jgi:hypothetical protein
MARSTVDGFDYRTAKPVSWTASQWRQQFPADQFVRVTGAVVGETWYRRKHRLEGHPRGERQSLVAEAYGIIPK